MKFVRSRCLLSRLIPVTAMPGNTVCRIRPTARANRRQTRLGKLIAALCFVAGVSFSLPGIAADPLQATGQPPTQLPEPKTSAPSFRVGVFDLRPSASPTEPLAKVYVLGPGDVVEIKVYQQQDLDTRTRVASDGSIRMPLLGAVVIGGKTAEQATTVIRELLAKDYLVNPQVTLTIAEYAQRLFTILGEVTRPGSYAMPAEQSLNLLQAIAMAGGYTRIGAPTKVTVQRSEGGKRKVYKLHSLSTANDPNAKPFEIQPNDAITVGEKLF